MAGGQELAVVQNSGNLGHEREQGAGEWREDNEGVPFHRLIMAGRHRGGGNLAEKRRRCF
jgi:hypothetical protein